MEASSEEAARELLEVVPAVMHAIRAEMRRHRACDVNVAQFRTLAYLRRNTGASLSEVAEHIGLTLPSMSKLIDGLVERKLVTRQLDELDRRRITLALTARGRGSLQTAVESTEAYLSEKLAGLTDGERASILEAMTALAQIFAAERSAEIQIERRPIALS